MEQEIRKADKVFRKRIQVIFFLVLLVSTAGYFILSSWSQGWFQEEENMEFAIQKTVILIKVLAYSVSIVSIFFGLYFLRTAILVFRFREFPVPNAKVMYDTKIKRGKDATLKGAIALFISILMLGIAVLFPIYIHTILRTLLSLPVG